MRRALLLLALALCLCSGCVRIPFHMVPATPRRTPTPEPEVATVVFVRPVQTGVREGNIITLVDDEGRFLGQLNDGDHFIATVAPGHHRVVGFFREKADLLDASLSAGGVYYVEVTVVPDGWYGRTEFQVIRNTPSAPDEAAHLLDETRQLVALVREADAALDQDAIQRRMANAQDRWRSYEDDQRHARTLLPDDDLVHGSPYF